MWTRAHLAFWHIIRVHNLALMDHAYVKPYGTSEK